MKCPCSSKGNEILNLIASDVIPVHLINQRMKDTRQHAELERVSIFLKVVWDILKYYVDKNTSKSK